MTHKSQRADVCIICALKKEADAVEQVIRKRCQVTFVTKTTDDGQITYRSTIITNTRGMQFTLVLLCQTRPGPVSAALNMGILLEKFQPCFVGMSGICAGDKQHVYLGDLVVAEYAYHFEEGKVIPDEQGGILHLPEGITYGPSPHVLQHIQTFEKWKTPVATLKKQMLGTNGQPKCVTTVMASAMAVHVDTPFPALQRQHRKTWALDMEAAAFYFALRAKAFVDGLVVKGVVDYADSTKDDTFHDFAAHASATYLLTFIQEYVTKDILNSVRNHTPPPFTVPSSRNAPFTRREALLTQIRARFQSGRAITLPQRHSIQTTNNQQAN